MRSNASSRKNFQVMVRIRPPLPRELNSDQDYRDVVTVSSDNNAVSISETGIDDSAVVPVHRFTFDYVYDQDSTQQTIYENSARDAVQSTLEGYNATVLAYGQTGTGKTFTMEGFDSSELRGIIPRSVEEIYDYIQNRAAESTHFLVRASYVQVTLSTRLGYKCI